MACYQPMSISERQQSSIINSFNGNNRLNVHQRILFLNSINIIDSESE